MKIHYEVTMRPNGKGEERVEHITVERVGLAGHINFRDGFIMFISEPGIVVGAFNACDVLSVKHIGKLKEAAA